MDQLDGLLARCAFPARGSRVALAVSGGGDSVGLALLAVRGGLVPVIHHVDHHLRPGSGDDAALVVALGAALGAPVEVHEITVEPGPNLEARARAARRAVLPVGVMTGHTMDDLAETVVLNLVRGAGLDGLSPMVGDPTKPLIGLRRAELRAAVTASGRPFSHDETNDDVTWRRNRLRHETLPLLNELADRDLVPVLARQAALLFDERALLDALCASDGALALGDADCRELATWPVARLRRWLRGALRGVDAVEHHPPTAAEVARAVGVVRGEAVAAELPGGWRLSRRHQRLVLEKTQQVRSNR